MVNFFKGLLNNMRLNDEDDYDYDYDLEEELKEEERARKRAERKERKQIKQQRKDDMMDTSTETSNTNRRLRSTRNESSKIVPIRSLAKGFEVSIMKPTAFGDSQEICDLLISNRVTVINLEGFDIDIAQRIMDFVSGCVYAINGKLHQISNYIFIVTPENVDITGDYLELLESNGFEVPTLNKEF